ncbi:MAG: hypothetical protein AAF639_18555, partial [Chloroflexota bacterium]
EFDGFTYPEKFLCLSTETELADHIENLAFTLFKPMSTSNQTVFKGWQAAITIIIQPDIN